MEKDYTVESGVIRGLPPPSAFHYGQRYVLCRHCKVLRPAAKLVLKNDQPVCRQHVEQKLRDGWSWTNNAGMVNLD